MKKKREKICIKDLNSGDFVKCFIFGQAVNGIIKEIRKKDVFLENGRRINNNTILLKHIKYNNVVIFRIMDLPNCETTKNRTIS